MTNFIISRSQVQVLVGERLSVVRKHPVSLDGAIGSTHLRDSGVIPGSNPGEGTMKKRKRRGGFFLKKIHIDNISYLYDIYDSNGLYFWKGKEKIFIPQIEIIDKIKGIYPLPHAVKECIQMYLNGKIEGRVVHHR